MRNLSFLPSFCRPARLFERALLRELTGLAAGVFFVLLGIMLVTKGARLLGFAAGGAVAPEAVGALLGFLVLGYVPVLLSLTVFLTVLLALTRAYRDHEMDIWFSAGQALSDWIKPVLTFAVPLALLAGVLSLGLRPWAEQKSHTYREQLAARDDMSSLAPGLFKESSRNDGVYFIENFSGAGGAARNIFVQSSKNGSQAVIVAEQGYLTSKPDGERILTLQRGRRYEGEAGQPDYRITEFEQAKLRIEEAPRQTTSFDTRSADSLTLWHSSNPEHRAELAFRISAPISAILLALVAIPLAFVNPRVGRSFNLILAVLLYLIYTNLLNLAESAIANGKLASWIGMWPVHGMLAIGTFLLFRWRMGRRR